MYRSKCTVAFRKHVYKTRKQNIHELSLLGFRIQQFTYKVNIAEKFILLSKSNYINEIPFLLYFSFTYS